MQSEAAAAATRRKRTLIASAIAAIVLTAGLGAGVWIAHDKDAATALLEVYVTDLPAEFTRLDVRIASIHVGEDRIPLQLDYDSFNLLALRGPEDALRIGRGMVPIDDDQEIRITFSSATVELDHKTIPVDIPETTLTLGHDYALAEGIARGVLFDIDVEQSLRIDGPSIAFEPFVDSVYLVAQGGLGATSKAPDTETPRTTGETFAATKPEAPAEQRLETPPTKTETQENPFEEVPRRNRQASPTPTNGTAPATPTDDPQPTDTEYFTPISDGGVNSVPTDYAETAAGWFIHYDPGLQSPEDLDKNVRALGADTYYRFQSVPAVYVGGEKVDIAALTNETYVTYVEPVMPVHLFLSSTKVAIRMPELVNPLNNIVDANGRPIDGRGVGVAVVDTGIDGLHPDLTHRLIAGNSGAPLVANFKVSSATLADTVYTDTTSGHGTHVAGIVAGQGTKEAGMKGVAPGAKLYGFGIGELTHTLWPNQAFDWIVQHGHEQNPPIKVVTNSWGTVGAHNPNSLTSRLVDQMVAQGMVVVFSAGNSGDQPGTTTSAECRNPRAGVICVAWYDDENTGSRTGKISPKSSKGSSTDASTWPDLSAPGSAVRSARTPFGWVTGVGITSYYVSLEGTSMAAPHVAGTAALLLQAKPGLTPAQVESILKETAVKYTDGGAYAANGGHLAKGNGLLDAYAAVQRAKQT